MNGMTKLHPNVPNSHPLRNPVVNMLPKILPATLNPKASITNKMINNSNDQNPMFNDDKKMDDVQTTGTLIGMNRAHKTVHNSLKINTIDTKMVQADKLSDKNGAKPNTVLPKSSKMSKDMPQISPELPQVRKTTPRLAKTKSAQNMKLMAQALSSKSSSNCSTLKSKEKDNIDKMVNEQCAESKIVSSILLSR